jgi:late competence protein required for DNA uptake (superfamily II DNA/RNA helicase)
MMVIGAKDPCLETPVHWVIQKARHDINALLQINSTTLFEKLKETLPTTEKETQPIALNRAKEILKTLRNGKTILIKNEGILFTGINIKEIQTALLEYLGVQK